MPKKKADDGQMFTFEHDGKTYTIPAAGDRVPDLPGGYVMDAYLDGDEGQRRLSFALLKMIASPEALKALREMPTSEMLAVVYEWESFRPSEEDADLGESSASSD